MGELLINRGSWAFNLNTDESDLDLLHIYMPTTNDLIMSGIIPNKQYTEEGRDDTGKVLEYDVVKQDYRDLLNYALKPNFSRLCILHSKDFTDVFYKEGELIYKAVKTDMTNLIRSQLGQYKGVLSSKEKLSDKRYRKDLVNATIYMYLTLLLNHSKDYDSYCAQVDVFCFMHTLKPSIATEGMYYLQNLKRMRTTDETPIEEVEELSAYVESLLLKLKGQVAGEDSEKRTQMKDYFINALKKVIVKNCVKNIIIKELEQL
jgi:hypothetical protein